MSDNQLGALCVMVFLICFYGVLGLRIWVDHKEEMKRMEMNDD